MTKEIITKLLKSKNLDDNLLGLEYQYQAFKHGYTNWYKREKYNREFVKRIFNLLYPDTNVLEHNKIFLTIQETRVPDWFKARLEEDFNNKML